jgi:hypothetical protein
MKPHHHSHSLKKKSISKPVDNAPSLSLQEIL